MRLETLRTRGVVFAFLFGPPRFVARDEASAIHGRLCQSLGWDDLSFQYHKTSEQVRERGPSGGFVILCERPEGRGKFVIRLEKPPSEAPLRLLMEYVWPPSDVHVREHFDMVHNAVFEQEDTEWQRVLAEVRIRSECAPRHGRSIDFIKKHLLAFSPDWWESLGGGLSFASIRLDVAAGDHGEDSLSNPKRELSLEVLREDPTCMYVELMSQWPQLAAPVAPGSPVSAGSIRPIDRKPSEYVENASEFLTERLASLAVKG